MNFTHFSRNGDILPIAEATVPLGNIEYSYGYGVYEAIRVSGGQPHFLDQHCQRLIESARIIGLEHGFNPDKVNTYVVELLKALTVEACNLKVLLIGGAEPQLYILASNPLFPDRKLYRDGAHAITYEYERSFPHAKTLNMLPSFLAYRDARAAGAYDALLINRRGHIVEGTRTNFFALKDRTIYSPPAGEILLGVTRDNVLKVAAGNGFELVEQDLPLDRLDQYDSLFLTSTSAKIMPVKSVNDQTWQISDNLRDLIKAFNDSLGRRDPNLCYLR
jgi:branched-chain amino acid aminotransferase